MKWLRVLDIAFCFRAKIQFDSHQSASAAVENPPLNLSVGFDKKFNSIKNNFVGKNNVRINNRYSPAMVESREAVGQYQVTICAFIFVIIILVFLNSLVLKLGRICSDFDFSNFISQIRISNLVEFNFLIEFG